MAKAVQKITLSPSRDIPFNKLVLSQSNVRRVKAGVSIEQLAESIAQRTLLQSLNVRAVLDADGNETGMFEVPAGGRRYRALELLVKQKRMAKTQPVPCVVREGGIAEDNSIAENDERVGLHPLDQFRAFQTLRNLGMSEEDIAARRRTRLTPAPSTSEIVPSQNSAWVRQRAALRHAIVGEWSLYIPALMRIPHSFLVGQARMMRHHPAASAPRGATSRGSTRQPRQRLGTWNFPIVRKPLNVRLRDLFTGINPSRFRTPH